MINKIFSFFKCKRLCLLFILISSTISSQNNDNNEVLYHLDYKQLRDSIRKYSTDFKKATLYSDIFSLKAKKARDTSRMASGYYMRIIIDKSRKDLLDTINKKIK